MEEITKSKVIEVDPEFLEVLKKLEKKIMIAAWDGLGKISKRSLTRILARKINASKLL